MGITLKVGDSIFYNPYPRWDSFKIELCKACIEFIKANNISLKNYSECDNTDNFKLLDFYTKLFIVNIEFLVKLNIIGIYHLIIVKNNRGIYMYDKSEKISKTITHVNEYIDIEKIDIDPYVELFENSWKNKHNIYIM